MHGLPPVQMRVLRGRFGWSMVPMLLSLALGCSERRTLPDAPPVYAGDLSRLFRQACADCHAGDAGMGGYHIDDYADVIGCSARWPEQPVVQPAAPRAALPWTLRYDAVHAELLSESELSAVDAWVIAGAPLRAGGVHGGQILRPGSPGFHAALLARADYADLLDPDSEWACGQCHAAAPVGGADVSVYPAGATACTACHDRPGGALACSTCHAFDTGADFVARDRCNFDDRVGAHRAHLYGGDAPAERAGLAAALTCGSCHPAADARLSGSHANGRLDVSLSLPEPAAASGEAMFDRDDGTCAVYCHDQGGTRSTPGWYDAAPMACDSCHGSPPDDHYAGACGDCHVEANADGTALRATALHLNGRVDVGRGPGCTGCHGSDGTPWPDTPSHRVHRDTRLTDRIVCESCHRVPQTVTAAGHLDALGAGDGAEVALDPNLAAPDAAAAPSYGDGRCSDILCHGGEPDSAFEWDAPAGVGCGRCHGAPPPPPHPRDSGCAQLICHGDEVGFSADGPTITAPGRTRHLDGQVQVSAP